MSKLHQSLCQNLSMPLIHKKGKNSLIYAIQELKRFSHAPEFNSLVFYTDNYYCNWIFFQHCLFKWNRDIQHSETLEQLSKPKTCQGADPPLADLSKSFPPHRKQYERRTQYPSCRKNVLLARPRKTSIILRQPAEETAISQ